MNKRVIILLFLFTLQVVADTLSSTDRILFTISLNNDSASIYGCRWDDRVRSNLAGPVLMQNESLLLYSQNGYVLYSKDGKLIDSHSLYKINRKAASAGDPVIKLAYPLDSTTILYYKELKDNTVEIYQKHLKNNALKRVKNDIYESYQTIASFQLFNIANNSITDEMSKKTFLMPHLVGYTALEKGTRWWTADKFYSFTSPIIMESNKKFTGFFPGLKPDQECDVKKHLIEPLGAYERGGRWFYIGIFTPMGNIDDEYFQTLLLCDQAGNLLYTNTLSKQEITDAVLQKAEKHNTIFTVRKAARYTYVPAVDRNGDIYYGVIDFEQKKIDIHKRMMYKYFPEKCGTFAQEYFVEEARLSCSPVIIECRSAAKRGVSPEIIRTNENGSMDMLAADDQMVDNYYVKIHRTSDPELRKKLKRVQRSLPEYVQSMQDSIAQLSSVWCPYGISINNKESGRLSEFHYGEGDSVLCARILQVTDSGLFVRIDCENHAEILVFTTNGKYLNRFTFNNQSFPLRKDLVIIRKDNTVFEKDFEKVKRGAQYMRWLLRTSEPKFRTRD